jgi:hypothetical protein
MINQQLLDFIKQQLQLGLTKEKITSELLENDWTVQDITEAFDTTITPISGFSSSVKMKSNSSRKIFLIALIIFLLASGASAYYFRNDLKNLPIIRNFFPNTPLLTSNTSIDTIIPTNPINLETPTLTGSILCAENDMNCFLTAAQENCSPATVKWNNGVDFYGITQIDKSKLTLGGFDSSGKCILYYFIEDANIILGSENKLQAKASGMTDAQIKEKIQEGNTIAKQRIGMTTKCLFDVDDMINFITKWSKSNVGNDSFEALSSGNCLTTNTNGEIAKINIEQPMFFDSSLLYKKMYLFSTSNVLDTFSNLIFEVISITKDQVKLNITQEATKKEETVTLVVGKQKIISGNILTITEIKEETYGINPILKKLRASLEITKVISE